MNNNSTNKKRLILLIVLIVFALLLYIIQLTISSFGFHIVSTDPSLGNVSSIEPYMQVNFNEQITSSGLKVTSSPSIIFNQAVEGKTLTLDFNTMNVNKTYTITISSIYSSKGAVIKNKTLSFTAKDISATDLSKAEQEAILKRQTNSNSPILSNPITKYLPYTTLSYSLNPLITKSNGQLKFELSAVITLSEADMGDESAAIAQYKQQINSYIQSVGLDPASYTIVYTVKTP